MGSLVRQRCRNPTSFFLLHIAADFKVCLALWHAIAISHTSAANLGITTSLLLYCLEGLSIRWDLGFPFTWSCQTCITFHSAPKCANFQKAQRPQLRASLTQSVQNVRSHFCLEIAQFHSSVSFCDVSS